MDIPPIGPVRPINPSNSDESINDKIIAEINSTDNPNMKTIIINHLLEEGASDGDKKDQDILNALGSDDPVAALLNLDPSNQDMQAEATSTDDLQNKLLKMIGLFLSVK